MKHGRVLLLAAGLLLGSPAVHADELDAGRQLFTGGTTPACAVCHTLRDAQATGEVGPVLDELKPDEARVAQVLRTGLGVMPSFRDKLSEAQRATLARYVSQVAGAPR